MYLLPGNQTTVTAYSDDLALGAMPTLSALPVQTHHITQGWTRQATGVTESAHVVGNGCICPLTPELCPFLYPITRRLMG
jgi:hypothetical protein